ncbi:putative bifunctional diguanylate cyclase/phosphodiesterase [Catenovulum adriaticum]|uniref:Bifunctional diguanylate cyclase/phosphodiesterase n=1 Tax=Catenovulum adriaticum TaxID=2984846 RepID=A0ABY7API8_9ALTE|nr:bifunctional diguanylate cyclase/phosphodiesterase [Catenovulum sp. TS8]WAJ70360.1 bifunctional diguanylate cyclase/phosphodiesterase [Catenovulum sp. TS8]
MKQALYLIALQHELSMSMGSELNLAKMLKAFLKVCLNRAYLASCHVYLYQDKNGYPKTSQANGDYQLNHYLSLPKRHQGELWQYQDSLKIIEEKLKKTKKIFGCSQIEVNGAYYYVCSIGHYGFLIWHSYSPIAAEIIDSVVPLIGKLEASCYAAIMHNELLIEMKARHKAEQKVAYQACHDGLTNLYNRDYLNALIEQSLAKSVGHRASGGVIFIDLNKFKSINDTKGHTVGDRLLLMVAQRLQQLKQNNIHIARYGGDEFVILIDQLPEEHEPHPLLLIELVQQIQGLFKPDFVIEQNVYNISASIGYCLFSAVDNADDLVKFADIAMYEAKQEKLLTGVEYKPYMSARLAEKDAFVSDMRQALANNEFQLYYQAQFNADNKITGAEALLRWDDPKRGFVSPEIYIPIAEESNLILEIGDWVIQQACKDIHQLAKFDLPVEFGNVAVNVSPKQLIQDDFFNRTMEKIKRDNVPCHLLSLEITENLMVENFSKIVDIMHQFKSLGVNCSIDDFGTGYSSLTYLKRIPANLVKIDRAFVTDICHNHESLAIAQMVIALGKSLGIDVIAEGVENKECCDKLTSVGCTLFQGYYFSRPVSFDDFSQLLKSAALQKEKQV